MSKFDRIRIDSKYFFFLIFLTSSTIYGKHSILPAFEIKTSVFLQNAWPFTFANQIKERLNICISLMWTLLSDWHIRFAEGCLWYLKYSLFWCLVGEFPSLNVTLLNICPSLPWQAQGYSWSFFIWTIFFHMY